MHKTLIKEIIHGSNIEHMEMLEDVLVDLIDDLKHTNHHKYKEIEYELYKAVHGKHLSEKLAHKWVDELENKDGTKGGHWTIEQTNQYADGNNKFDWYVAMNVMYSDFYNPKFDTNTYVELAKDFIHDKDASECKLIKYYMFVVRD